jgi:hypothetical protein
MAGGKGGNAIGKGRDIRSLNEPGGGFMPLRTLIYWSLSPLRWQRAWKRNISMSNYESRIKK